MDIHFVVHMHLHMNEKIPLALYYFTHEYRGRLFYSKVYFKLEDCQVQDKKRDRVFTIGEMDALATEYANEGVGSIIRLLKGERE